MIAINSKIIETIYRGKLPIQEIRKGAQLVWEAIKGCFGGGFWKNEKGWINTEGWRNTK